MSKLKCSCHYCTVDSPKHKGIRELLTGQALKDFDYFMNRLMCAEEDRNVADAKLEGSWPGFEWMKEAMQKHGYK